MTWMQFLELGLSLSLQVTLVVVLCHWLGRFVNPREQCRLWTTCFVMTLLLSVAALTLPHLRLFSWSTNVATPNFVGLVTLEMQLGKTLFFVWLAGSGVMLLLTVYGMIQTSRFLKTCQPVDPEVLRFSDLDDKATLSPIATREVQLLSSKSVVSPFCWQFHRPCIVLPEYLLTIDRDQLRFVVRHEQEHLRTGHPLQLFLQRCVEIVFWFHPLVWWAARQVTVSREVACDVAAVNSPADIVKYLRTLLSIVERSAMPSHWALRPLAFLGTRSVIASRTRRLVELARGTTAARPPQLSGQAASAGLVAASVLTMAIWLPVDLLGPSASGWSPWPKWTAGVLHDFGIHARDFEAQGSRDNLQELIDPDDGDDDLPRRETSEGAAATHHD